MQKKLSAFYIGQTEEQDETILVIRDWIKLLPNAEKPHNE